MPMQASRAQVGGTEGGFRAGRGWPRPPPPSLRRPLLPDPLPTPHPTGPRRLRTRGVGCQ